MQLSERLDRTAQLTSGVHDASGPFEGPVCMGDATEGGEVLGLKLTELLADPLRELFELAERLRGRRMTATAGVTFPIELEAVHIGIAQAPADRFTRADSSRAGRVQRLYQSVQSVTDLAELSGFLLPCLRRERPTLLPSSVQLLQDRPLVRFRRVQLEAEIAEAARFEPPIDDFERSHLLGHEQHPMPERDVVRDDVSDRFGLAGSRRALENEITFLTRCMDRDNLRAVGVQRRHQLGRIDLRIDRMGFQKHRAPCVSVAGRLDHMLDERTLLQGFSAVRQIFPH
ncbi:MAG: hypothetical protein WBE98_05065 [Gammaproteobacteria bacterium]